MDSLETQSEKFLSMMKLMLSEAKGIKEAIQDLTTVLRQSAAKEKSSTSWKKLDEGEYELKEISEKKYDIKLEKPDVKLEKQYYDEDDDSILDQLNDRKRQEDYDIP